MQARGVEQSFKPIDMYYDTKMTWSTSGEQNQPVWLMFRQNRIIKMDIWMGAGNEKRTARIAYVNQYSGTPNIKKITITAKNNWQHSIIRRRQQVINYTSKKGFRYHAITAMIFLATSM